MHENSNVLANREHKQKSSTYPKKYVLKHDLACVLPPIAWSEIFPEMAAKCIIRHEKQLVKQSWPPINHNQTEM